MEGVQKRKLRLLSLVVALSWNIAQKPNLVERCYLRLIHWAISVPYVGLGSACRYTVALDLSFLVRPIQYYLLSLSQDCSFLSSG